MALEIERKFLVSHAGWRCDAVGRCSIRQGYFPRSDGFCVRVRVVDGQSAFLTIKGSGRRLIRPEFEYAVPVEDALTMLDEFCGQRVVVKERYFVRCGRHTWEVDVFGGRHAPLVLAEIELASADEAFERPAWLGDEVTGQEQYANEFLAGQA